MTNDALELFGLRVHWYGLIIAVGIALAVALASAREQRLGLPRDTALDLALAGVPAALVGARLYYVAFSWPYFAAAPVRILRIWEGGLAIYGGLLGGILAGWIYSRLKKRPFWKLADLAAPSFALGQAIGRWGNFVNQEAYGPAVREARLRFFPVAVWIQAEGEWHYATFFYESAWCLIIVILLLLAERRRWFRWDGACFTGYAFLYAMERALVEGLRTDSLYWGGVRVSQALSLVALLAAGAVFVLRAAKKPLPAGALAACGAMAVLLVAGLPWLALAAAAMALAVEAAGLAVNGREMPVNSP